MINIQGQSLNENLLSHLFEGNYLKVAEHSFQVPMPNSPLLLNYIYALAPAFFARVKANHRSIHFRNLVRVCAVAVVTGLVKNKAQKNDFSLFKKNPVAKLFS